MTTCGSPPQGGGWAGEGEGNVPFRQNSKNCENGSPKKHSGREELGKETG